MVITFIIGTPISAEVTKGNKNHIENGGFEEIAKEEDIEGWSIYAAGQETPGFVTDEEHVKEGKNAGYVVQASSLTYNLENLKKHTTYVYSAYVKIGDDGDGDVKVGAKLYDGDEPDIAVDAEGNTYEQYSVEFTTGDQTTAQVYIWSPGNNLDENQKAYIDDVNVTEKDAEDGKNLVTNPLFDKITNDPRPAKWQVSPDGDDAPSTTTNSEHVYKGKRSAYITPQGSLSYEVEDLRKNTNYSFSAYFKMDDPDAQAEFGVKDIADKTSKTVEGATYSKEEIIFNTGDQTTATIYFSGNALTGDQRGYIDEAVVEEHFEDGQVRVSLNMSDLLLAKGHTYPLSATVIPSDAANKTISYTSGDEQVATVDDAGNITAVGSGQTEIIAEPDAGGKSAVTDVTVTENKEPWYPDRANTEWELTKEDNFEGTELDTDLWTIRGKETATYHRDDLVTVEDGKLKLGIEREENGDLVLGRVDTKAEDVWGGDAKFNQKYGFFEVSAKIPPTEKTYFAFWMNNHPGVDNVSGGGKEGVEIDITETVYQDDVTEAAIHYDGYNEEHKSIGSGQQPAPNIHDGFHVFGLEWDEDYLKFYFDGELTWEVTDENLIPWVKEIFILSSGWARADGWGDGNADDADLPYHSEVDWFRAYERKDQNAERDTTEPLFYGVDDIEIPLNSPIDMMEKVYAVDNRDDVEELLPRIEMDESDLQRDEKGEYIVKYTVEDKAGNEATAERKVTVVDVDEDEPENLIKNGAFDKDELDDWDFEPSTANVQHDIVRGKYLHLKEQSRIQQDFPVKPHTTYEVSFDGKFDTAEGNQRLYLGVDYGSDQIEQDITEALWRTHAFEFTTGPNDDLATMYMNNEGEDGGFFNHISVIEVESESEPVPPVTTSNIADEWVNDDFKVELEVEESSEQDIQTYYAVNGSEFKEGTTVTVRDEGVNEINFYSVDENGHIETMKTADVKIDKTAPTVSWDLKEELPKGTELTIDYEAEDAVSGIKEESVKVNGEKVTKGDVMTLDKPGHYDIKIAVVDHAGWETVFEKTVVVFEGNGNDNEGEKGDDNKAEDADGSNKNDDTEGNESSIIEGIDGDDGGQSSVSDNQLPKTATNMHKWMAIGGVLFMLGIGFLIAMRLKTSKATK